jgi:hypothetical protein
MTAMRDAPRNGSTPADATRGCALCGQPRPTTRRGRYCTAACRQRAFRLRRAAATDLDQADVRAELRRRRALVAHTVYECGICGERLVGERRCPDCNVYCRALGLGGGCPECDQPIVLTDLLGLEVMP